MSCHTGPPLCRVLLCCASCQQETAAKTPKEKADHTAINCIRCKQVGVRPFCFFLSSSFSLYLTISTCSACCTCCVVLSGIGFCLFDFCSLDHMMMMMMMISHHAHMFVIFCYHVQLILAGELVLVCLLE